MKMFDVFNHIWPNRFPGFIGTAIMSNPKATLEDARCNVEDHGALKHPHLEHGAATATFGAFGANSPAMDFLGKGRELFASNAPFDPEQGPMYIRDTIKTIDELDITDTQRSKIFQDDAMAFLGLEI